MDPIGVKTDNSGQVPQGPEEGSGAFARFWSRLFQRPPPRTGAAETQGHSPAARMLLMESLSWVNEENLEIIDRICPSHHPFAPLNPPTPIFYSSINSSFGDVEITLRPDGIGLRTTNGHQNYYHPHTPDEVHAELKLGRYPVAFALEKADSAARAVRELPGNEDFVAWVSINDSRGLDFVDLPGDRASLLFIRALLDRHNIWIQPLNRESRVGRREDPFTLISDEFSQLGYPVSLPVARLFHNELGCAPAKREFILPFRVR